MGSIVATLFPLPPFALLFPKRIEIAAFEARISARARVRFAFVSFSRTMESYSHGIQHQRHSSLDVLPFADRPVPDIASISIRHLYADLSIGEMSCLALTCTCDSIRVYSRYSRQVQESNACYRIVLLGMFPTSNAKKARSACQPRMSGNAANMTVPADAS